MRLTAILLGACLLLGGSPLAAGEREPGTSAVADADPTPPPGSAEGDTEAGTSEPESSGTIRGKNLWETLSRGGLLMLPILACSLVGLAFTIERLISLRQSAVAPKGLPDKVIEAIGNGGAAHALQACEKRPSSLSRVLAAGLALADRPKEEVVAAMEEAGERELWHLGRFAKPLNVIAGVSPLLGLLGTVWGMIVAFDVVAQFGALGDPKQLASGIATALLTTLAGLSVAIPCYLLYHYFRSKNERMIVEIEETASRVANALKGTPAHANPSPPGGGRGAAADAAD